MKRVVVMVVLGLILLPVALQGDERAAPPSSQEQLNTYYIEGSQDLHLMAYAEPAHLRVYNSRGTLVWEGDLEPYQPLAVPLPPAAYRVVASRYFRPMSREEAELARKHQAELALRLEGREEAGSLAAGPGSDGGLQSLAPSGPVVIHVPWAYQGMVELPHETYNGRQVTIKAIARNLLPLPLGSAGWRYRIAFGDGSFFPPAGYQPITPSANGTVYAIEGNHTYPNQPTGVTFTARIEITPDLGATVYSDTYRVIVKDNTRSTHVNVAIDEGLWYLHKSQTRGDYTDGSPWGAWTQNYYPATTAVATEAFEFQGHRPSGDYDKDPYVETVIRGLNYLLANIHTVSIAAQPAGDPDSNGNGIGLAAYHPGNSSHTGYEHGMVMQALASSLLPGRMAPNTTVFDPNVRGRSYANIVQDLADCMAYGQTESGNYRGGWRYSSGVSANYGNSDMSVSQWPVLGLQAAEERFGTPVPGWVKSELRDHFLSFVQHANGWHGYSWVGDNTWSGAMRRTGAGLACLAWCGVPPGDARVQNAVNWIGANWSGGNPNIGDAYAMYAVMKGAKVWQPTQGQPNIVMYGSHDWYDEYARYLTGDPSTTSLGAQNAAGYWAMPSNPGGWGTYLQTGWAILILTPTVTDPEFPVAVLNAAPNPADIGTNILFNGSNSYDTHAPPSPIVEYHFDFDDGMAYTETSAPGGAPDGLFDGKTTHAYAAYGNYNATLQVVNQIGQTSNLDVVPISITTPDHPPTAVIAKPVVGFRGVPTTLNGSASFDINAPDDFITEYAWDLDGGSVSPMDEDIIGPDEDIVNVDHVGKAAAWDTLGQYPITLRVKDKPGLFADSPKFGYDTAEVQIVNRLPIADADGPYLFVNPTADPTASILFDGSGSDDPDLPPWDDIVLYEWDFDGDGVYDASKTDTDPDPPMMEKTWADLTGMGLAIDTVYNMVLRVTDEDGGQDTDTTTLILTGNQPPTANAGPDQTVEQTDPQGTLVTLDGSGSSDDGNIQPLSYEWSVGGAPVANGVSPNVSFPLGTTTVTLEVDDGQFTDTDTVDITVEDTTPPQITCPADITVPQQGPNGAPVNFTVTATDICDADVTIECVDQTGAPVASGDWFPVGDTHVFCTATDDSGNQSQCDFWIHVTTGQSTAEMTGRGYLLVGGRRALFRISGKASPLGGSLLYSGPPGRTIFQSTSIASFSVAGNMATMTGQCTYNGAPGYSFVLMAQDGPDSFQLQVNGPGGYNYSVGPSPLAAGDISVTP